MTQTLGRYNSSNLNKPNKFSKYLKQKWKVQQEVDKFRIKVGFITRFSTNKTK